MGVEKNQYLGLWAYSQGGVIKSFAKPSKDMTANQIIMALVLLWITTGDKEARRRLLEIARIQTTPGLRHGIGVVEGKIEGWCLDHHGNYHYLAILCLIKQALFILDDEMLEAGLNMLANVLELLETYSSPDGQVACAGWRAWPYSVKGDELNELLDDNGWHRSKPGGTLSVASDTMNRVWQGLAQLDNKHEKKSNEWMRKNRSNEGSWQPAILLLDLLEKHDLRDELEEIAWSYEMIYPVPLTSEHGKEGFEVRMSTEPVKIAPKAWGPAPAVRLIYDKNKNGHRHTVCWYPRVLPTEPMLNF